MSTRLIVTALVAAVLVVALGGFTLADQEDVAGPAREQALEASLDHPHQERPAAATSPRTTATSSTDTSLSFDLVGFETAAAAASARRSADIATLAAALAAQAQARAAAAAAARQAARTPAQVLACIRHRESRGSYTAVNRSSGAAGAYQFLPGTWDGVARAVARPDLVGVSPAAASPADQDALAAHLLATRGLAPWGGACG